MIAPGISISDLSPSELRWMLPLVRAGHRDLAVTTLTAKREEAALASKRPRPAPVGLKASSPASSGECCGRIFGLGNGLALVFGGSVPESRLITLRCLLP